MQNKQTTKWLKSWHTRLLDEKGSVILLVSVLITALVVLTGVVVDGGSVYMEKQRIQTALDAAALAGGQQLPDTADATSVAMYFAGLNGLDTNKVTVECPTNNKIVVQTTEVVDLLFMPIIKINTVDLALRAAAAKGDPQWANYALFSGSTIDLLTLSGNHYQINGSTHTNQNFRANGNNMTITGVCDAVGSIAVHGTDMDIANRRPYYDFISLPDYSSEVKSQIEAVGAMYASDVSFTGSSINVENSIYVDGEVHLGGNNITGCGSILSEGDMHINGNMINTSTDDAVCLYSNGDIHINGTGIVISGLLYAPHGKIYIDGNDVTITGKVVANEIVFAGNTVNITDNDSAVKVLPGAGSRLVE